MKSGRSIFAVLAFAIVMLVVTGSATQAAVEARLMQSLQPFQEFGKGEGEGIALEYSPRNKAQFVAWLQGEKKRVSCETLVRQMAEIHGLPFEGCEGASTTILNSSDFVVVNCLDVMFSRDNLLVVTNSDGTAFGTWHRKCLPGEKVIVYKGRVIISTMCGNVAIPVSTQPKVAAVSKPPATTNECPSGFTLIVNAWAYSELPSRMKDSARRMIKVAESRDSKEARDLEAYRGDAFSRTFGGNLRREVVVRARVNTEIYVRFVDKDPRTGWLVVSPVGTINVVNGTGSFRFQEDPRGRIIETSWPQGFMSPTISGGERLLRLFPEEWGSHCTMNLHGLVR